MEERGREGKRGRERAWEVGRERVLSERERETFPCNEVWRRITISSLRIEANKRGGD